MPLKIDCVWIRTTVVFSIHEIHTIFLSLTISCNHFIDLINHIYIPITIFIKILTQWKCFFNENYY